VVVQGTGEGAFREWEGVASSGCTEFGVGMQRDAGAGRRCGGCAMGALDPGMPASSSAGVRGQLGWLGGLFAMSWGEGAGRGVSRSRRAGRG